MHSIARKSSPFEHEDIFQILEEWEQSEARITLPATPFGSVPTQPSYLHPAEASQTAAASASLYGPLLATPDAEYGVRQQSAPQFWSLESHPEHLHRRATYPVAGPGPIPQAESVKAQSLTEPSAAQPWMQQSPDPSQQHLVPEWLNSQGNKSSQMRSLAIRDTVALQ